MSKDARQELIDYQKEVEKKLEVFIYRVLLKIKGEALKILYENDKVGYSKQLTQNLREEIIKRAGVITGVVGVGANVPYAIYVHEGRGPGKMPPVDNILKWVIYKGIVSDSAGKPATLQRMKARKKEADQLSKARSVAFAIAKKISKHGTPGFKFMERALEQSVDFVADEISRLNLI